MDKFNNEDNTLKKVKYNVGDIIYVNDKEGKIIFGPFEKGYFSFYEVESEGQVFTVNSKDIKKKA